jgi:hypothetical protein
VLAAGENSYHVYGVSRELLAILSAAALTVLTVALVVVRRTRLRRRKLRAFDPCQRCGFDLRATTGPCPECGARRSESKPADRPRPAPKDLFDDFQDEPWHVS